MRVELTLVAKDFAGQIGKSETIEITLPERRFTKPLARAVIEQRRKLVEDPRDRLLIAKAIDALTLEPEDFIEDLQVFLGPALGLLAASARGHAHRPQQRDRPALERGPAHRGRQPYRRRARLAAPRKTACSKRCADGASDEEIQRLMQELRQALAQFMEQLASRRKASRPRRATVRNQQMLSQQDLEQMLRNLENMARSGNREMAEQMLSQLRDLLDRLQSGRMADQGQSQRLGKMMDEFGDIIGRASSNCSTTPS